MGPETTVGAVPETALSFARNCDSSRPLGAARFEVAEIPKKFANFGDFGNFAEIAARAVSRIQIRGQAVRFFFSQVLNRREKPGSRRNAR